MSQPYVLPPAPARPKKFWFVLGLALMVLAGVVFVVGAVTTFGKATQTDSTATLTGPEPVEMSALVGEERMLFEDGQATLGCSVAGHDGAPIQLEHSAVRTSVTTGDRKWRGLGTFVSSDPDILVTCDAPAGTVLRVGEPLGVGFVGGVMTTILLPMLLGGIGVVVLLVTTILWFVRAPRRQPPPE